MQLPFLVNFQQYNNCSLPSSLSKCGAVFIKKNAKKKKKKKKKWSTFKNLLPHISTTEALQNIIPTDSESYSSRLQLLFFTIHGNWSCDHPPDTLDGP